MDDIVIKHDITSSSLESALENLTSALSKFSDMGIKNHSTNVSIDNITPQERSKIRVAEYQQKLDSKAIKGEKTAIEELNKIKLDGENKLNIAQTLHRQRLQEFEKRGIEQANILSNKFDQEKEKRQLAFIEKTALLSKRHELDIAKLKEQADIKLNTLREKNAINDERSWGRIGKGLILGSVLSSVYMMHQFGSTSGKEAGSLNANASNYLAFQQNLYNMQTQNQSNLATVVSGAIGGVLGSIIPGVGTAFGAMAGGVIGTGVGGYFSGKWSEEEKARYEFGTNKEFQAWQLQQMGISGKSNTQLYAGKNKFNLTRLQDNANAVGGAYTDSTVQFALHGRRDIVNRMSNAELANFSKQAQQNAMAIGANPDTFMNAIAHMSAVTGKNPDTIRKQAMNDVRKYGGDINSNLMKMVQLMQTTPLGAKSAENLVNRYQYNDAMIKNKVNASQADPFGIFKSSILLKLAGANEGEIKQVLSGGVMPSRLKSIISSGQRHSNGTLGTNALSAELLMMGAGAVGVNPFVNAIGGVKPTIGNESAIANAPTEPSTLRDMSTMVANQLQNIIVNGNITVSGGNTEYQRLKDKITNDFANNLKMNELPPNGVALGQGVH